MENQVGKDDKYVQTDYALVINNQGYEELLPCLDDGTIISYEFEDKFLQDHANSYEKWKKDGERFLKDEFVDEFIQTGKIPVLNDGRPEMEQFFYYITSTNAFLVEWGNTRILIKPFIENMLKVYKEHGNVPEYLSSISQTIIGLVEWNPSAD